MQISRPRGDLRRRHRANPWLNELAVVGEIDFRHAIGRRKPPLVFRGVAAHRAEIIKRPLFTAHDPLAAGEIGIRSISGLRFEGRLIETRRQHIDQVYVAGEFAVLLLGNAAGDENSEMTHGLMNRVNDRLPVIPYLVDIAVKIENPAERLLWWRDVVALGTEHHDGGSYLAQINHLAIRGFDPPGRQIVADEQFIDNELDLLGVQVDVAAPPALEFKIAFGLGVALGIDVILLAPERVRRIHVFEILHQPRAIELAAAEIAGERSQPAPA